MKELTAKEKSLAISVGLLLVIFALKSLVIGPINDKIATYNQQIEQSQMGIRKYTLLENNRPQILKAQKQVEGYSSFKGSDEDKLSMVMSKVELEARKSNLQILDMSPGASNKSKSGGMVYRVSLRAEGQFKNVLDFISAIEGANILLQVEKIVLAAKDETGTTLKIDTTISGVSFTK